MMFFHAGVIQGITLPLDTFPSLHRHREIDCCVVHPVILGHHRSIIIKKRLTFDVEERFPLPHLQTNNCPSYSLYGFSYQSDAHCHHVYVMTSGMRYTKRNQEVYLLNNELFVVCDVRQCCHILVRYGIFAKDD